MKKILLALLVLGLAKYGYAGTITVDPFVTPDSVTVEHLETFRTTVLDVINGNIGTANIQNDSVAEQDMANDANVRIFFDDAFNNYVKSGLLPPTSASLVTTTTAGLAYIDGFRISKDAVEHTYSATVWTFVDISNNGTYTYVESVIGAAEPGVTASSLRLARVSTDSTTVSVVRDDRVLSIATAGSEDFYRVGLSISADVPATMVIKPGNIKHGSTYLSKVSNSTLSLATASDWVTGVSGRTVSTYAYVVIDSSGNIKFTTTAPTKSDTSGNTAGVLRYSVVNSIYYRVLGWFYMDENGSGNLNDAEWSDISDVNVLNSVYRVSSELVQQTGAVVADDTIPLATEGSEFMAVRFRPSSTTSKVKIEVSPFLQNSSNAEGCMFILRDSTPLKATAIQGNGGAFPLSYSWLIEDQPGTTTPITYRLRAGATAGNTTLNGSGASRRYGGSAASTMKITEIK